MTTPRIPNVSAFITHAVSIGRPRCNAILLNTRTPLLRPFQTRRHETTQRRRPLAIQSPSASANPNTESMPPSSNDKSTVLPSSKLQTEERKVAVVGVIFLIISYIWSFLLFIPMLIMHPLVMWRDRATRKFHDFIAMAWMRCSLWTVRVRPKIINAENVPPVGTPVVYVANHTSYLDIFTFAYLYRRIKYVSKAEIFRLPVVGWAMEMAGNIALMRMSARGQMEAYHKMEATIRNGLSLVVFPEGTRSVSGKLQRFKMGAFRAAKKQNVPVVPITILGTREVMPSTAWVPLRYPTLPISLVIHKAIEPKGSIGELAEEAFRAIDSGLPAHYRQDSEDSGSDEEDTSEK